MALEKTNISDLDFGGGKGGAIQQVQQREQQSSTGSESTRIDPAATLGALAPLPTFHAGGFSAPGLPQSTREDLDLLKQRANDFVLGKRGGVGKRFRKKSLALMADRFDQVAKASDEQAIAELRRMGIDPNEVRSNLDFLSANRSKELNSALTRKKIEMQLANKRRKREAKQFGVQAALNLRATEKGIDIAKTQLNAQTNAALANISARAQAATIGDMSQLQTTVNRLAAQRDARIFQLEQKRSQIKAEQARKKGSFFGKLLGGLGMIAAPFTLGASAIPAIAASEAAGAGLIASGVGSTVGSIGQLGEVF